MNIPNQPALYRITKSSDPWVDRDIVMAGPVGGAWNMAKHYPAARVLEIYGNELKILYRSWQKPYIDELFSYIHVVVNSSQDVTVMLQLEDINSIVPA